MTAGHFEAKKHAVRQTQDGWVVSFTVHPNDMSADFATAPLGTRYMVGFAAIGDDEQPISGNSAAMRPAPEEFEATPAQGVSPTITASERGKARYTSGSDMDKALIRAARLPKDERFRDWVIEHNTIVDDLLSDEDAAVQFIRDRCCAGESRKLIAEDRDCYEAFVRMETTFLIETGVLAAPR